MLIGKEIKFLNMLSTTRFEGSEKKIEFSVIAGSLSLRTLPHAKILEIVELANAKIVSSMKTANCDAYILSESSLFVFDQRLIMITCGTSTLVKSALKMLEWFPISSVQSFIFKRQQEWNPQNRITSFDEDTLQLRQILPGKICDAGVGRQKIQTFVYGSSPVSTMVSVEILLKNISENWYPGFSNPDFSVSEHYFQPTGYSMNAVSLQDEYYSIHVTPGDQQLDASFQGSFQSANLANVISNVFKTFAPKEHKIFITTEYPEVSVRELTLQDDQKEFSLLPDLLFETAI